MQDKVLLMRIEEFNRRSEHFSDDDFSKMSLVLHFGEGDMADNLRYIERVEKITAVKVQRITPEHLAIVAERFPNLEHLDLTMNIMRELPACIKEFHKLKNLTAKGMAMTHLTPEIFELESLETLDVSINKLSSIPSDISRLNFLKQFIASNNSLTDINLDDIHCEQVNLSNNRISKVICTRDAYSINGINLSRNAFTSITELVPIFKHGVSFLRLDLSSNRLTDFDSLPSDSYAIFTNGTICVCNCGLDTIPNIFISAIRRWKGIAGETIFDLSFNNISSLGEFESDFNANSELGRRLRSNFILQGNPIDDTGFRTLDSEIHIAFSKRTDLHP